MHTHIHALVLVDCLCLDSLADSKTSQVVVVVVVALWCTVTHPLAHSLPLMIGAERPMGTKLG